MCKQLDQRTVKIVVWIWTRVCLLVTAERGYFGNKNNKKKNFLISPYIDTRQLLNLLNHSKVKSKNIRFSTS